MFSDGLLALLLVKAFIRLPVHIVAVFGRASKESKYSFWYEGGDIIIGYTFTPENAGTLDFPAVEVTLLRKFLKLTWKNCPWLPWKK